jgi:hypothetical protein
MKALSLKKQAELKNIVIISIRKDKKHEGFNVKSYVRYMNTVTEIKETFFSSKNEIEYWINEHINGI